jgi:hypothetical protein
MDSVSSEIKFEYEFLSESDAISNKDKRNATKWNIFTVKGSKKREFLFH